MASGCGRSAACGKISSPTAGMSSCMRFASISFADVVANERHRVVGGCSRTEHGADAELRAELQVLVGDDATGEHQDVAATLLAEPLHDLGEQLAVRARQD